MEQTQILKNLSKISTNGNLLNVLLQIEDIFSRSNLYVYPNWIEGEIAIGPNITKHWVSVSLKYPRKKMPDPFGAKVLENLGIIVNFKKEHIITNQTINKPADVNHPGNRSEKVKTGIWIIDLEIPRDLVEETDIEKIQNNDIDNALDIDSTTKFNIDKKTE